MFLDAIGHACEIGERQARGADERGLVVTYALQLYVGAPIRGMDDGVLLELLGECNVTRLGYTRKKGALRAAAASRADVVQAREEFVSKMKDLDISRAVFLDEMSINTEQRHAS